ncbi:MAG: hypothetical protein U0441_07125 [Polyangiaceae bacterium]
MKLSVESLFEAVYRHYPRNIAVDDDLYKASEEYQRLAAARRSAGTGEQREIWYAFLRRVDERLSPAIVQNMSLHLPTGAHDAGYIGHVFLPDAEGRTRPTIGLLISFLVPCYLLYRWHVELREPDPAMVASAAASRTFFLGDTMYVVKLDHPAARFIPPTVFGPQLHSVEGLDFFPEERPHADWLAQEIQKTWGAEPMPPEIGRLVVPDIALGSRRLGEATLYDCLFTDQR